MSKNKSAGNKRWVEYPFIIVILRYYIIVKGVDCFFFSVNQLPDKKSHWKTLGRGNSRPPFSTGRRPPTNDYCRRVAPLYSIRRSPKDYTHGGVMSSICFIITAQAGARTRKNTPNINQNIFFIFPSVFNNPQSLYFYGVIIFYLFFPRETAKRTTG